MVVIDEYTLAGIVAVLVIASRIVNSQGGAQIVLWRIRGVPWFLHTQIQPDGNTLRKALPMKIVKTHSLPQYTFQGKTWFTGGAEETARVWGGPQWLYNYNDSRPVPRYHVRVKMVEVEETVKLADGTETKSKTMKPVVIAVKPIDPTLIHSAFENKSIEAFNKLSDKPASKVKWGLLGFAIFVILILSAFSVLYTYYYGVNIACAVHAHGVNCT